MRALSFCVLILLASGAARCEQIDKAKIRSLLHLPLMEINFKISLTPDTEIESEQEKAEVEVRAANLKKLIDDNPKDTKRLIELGDLYGRLRHQELEADAYKQALKLLAEEVKQSASADKSGRYQLERGNALYGLSQYKEAEEAFRSAIALEPKVARAWMGLAGVLLSRVWIELAGKPMDRGLTTDDPAAVQRAVGEIVAHKPKPDALSEAERLLKESASSYQRAVDLAGDDPEPYQQGLVFRLVSEIWMSGLIEAARGNGDYASSLAKATSRIQREFVNPQVGAIARRVAELRKSDYRALAFAAMIDVMGALINNPNDSSFDVIGKLPQESQNRVKGYLEALTRISEGSEGSAPAGAALALGTLYYFAHNLEAAERSLKTSLARDPNRSKTYELMMGMYVSSKRFADMVTIIEQRLKREDTARNRLTLAKAYEKQAEWTKVEEQTRKAAAMAPDDFTAQLALSTILIKNGGQLETGEAHDQFDKVGALYEKNQTQHNWREYMRLRAAVLALLDRADEAQTQLKEILEHFPDDEDTKSLEAAIGK